MHIKKQIFKSKIKFTIKSQSLFDFLPKLAHETIRAQIYFIRAFRALAFIRAFRAHEATMLRDDETGVFCHH